MILVVGATGQLGSDIVRRLSDAKKPVRAFVRARSGYSDLDRLEGVEVSVGDLQDAASIDRAMHGITEVVSTANTVAPRKGDRRRDILDRGYAHLIDAAEREGVSQFLYVSVPEAPDQNDTPEFRYKRINEQRLLASSVPHTILRFPPFIEVWLALAGSSIPERGESRSTLQRPYAFTRRFRKLTSQMVEGHGRLLVNGSARNRHAFISIHDVSRIVAASIGHPAAIHQVLEIGGPNVLDWNDVAALWSRLLDRPVRVTVVPRAVFRINRLLMKPFSDNAANIMGLNSVSCRMETPWEPGAFVEQLGIGPLKTVEEVVRDKLAIVA